MRQAWGGGEVQRSFPVSRESRGLGAETVLKYGWVGTSSPDSQCKDDRSMLDLPNLLSSEPVTINMSCLLNQGDDARD
jgi:hypothetical protein